jgi:hypothetical protein
MNEEDLSKLTDSQLYDLIIRAQEALINKRALKKMDLEVEEKFGLEYQAIVNEVNTLKKGVITLKLFRKAV